jgi:hypothetical protein
MDVVGRLLKNGYPILPQETTRLTASLGHGQADALEILNFRMRF